MSQPIAPRVPKPRGRSRWSLPVTLLGAASMLVVSRAYKSFYVGFGLFMLAVVVAMVLDDYAGKRSG